MKTFKDLEFKQHSVDPTGKHAVIEDFGNGYGISVVSGGMFYTSENKPYEIAVLHKDSICYTTPITDDVIGYQTAEQVTEIMKQIQELKEVKQNEWKRFIRI